jgi:hypothetical protein
MNKQAEEEYFPTDPNNVVYQSYDGERSIQKVTSAHDAEVEGNKMHNCVGAYANYIESGKIKVFSIRIKGNKPVATIGVADENVYSEKNPQNLEFEGKTIFEIKGVNNSKIDENSDIGDMVEYFLTKYYPDYMVSDDSYLVDRSYIGDESTFITKLDKAVYQLNPSLFIESLSELEDKAVNGVRSFGLLQAKDNSFSFDNITKTIKDAIRLYDCKVPYLEKSNFVRSFISSIVNIVNIQSKKEIDDKIDAYFSNNLKYYNASTIIRTTIIESLDNYFQDKIEQIKQKITLYSSDEKDLERRAKISTETYFREDFDEDDSKMVATYQDTLENITNEKKEERAKEENIILFEIAEEVNKQYKYLYKYIENKINKYFRDKKLLEQNQQNVVNIEGG